MARNTRQRKIDVYIMPLQISSYGSIARLLCYSLKRIQSSDLPIILAMSQLLLCRWRESLPIRPTLSCRSRPLFSPGLAVALWNWYVKLPALDFDAETPISCAMASMSGVIRFGVMPVTDCSAGTYARYVRQPNARNTTVCTTKTPLQGFCKVSSENDGRCYEAHTCSLFPCPHNC